MTKTHRVLGTLISASAMLLAAPVTAAVAHDSWPEPQPGSTGGATATVNDAPAAVTDDGAGISVTASATSTQSTQSHTASDNTITCTFKIDNPHQSGTPGFQHRWSVHATLRCSGYGNGNVPWMYSSVDLARNAEWSLFWNPVHAYDKNNVTGNASAECRLNQPTDNWQGRALGHVQMPAGYEPMQLDLDVESPVIAQEYNCAAPPAR